MTITAILLAVSVLAFGPGGRFRLEQSSDGFGTRCHGVEETLGGGRTKLYPLPQSTAADYMRLRPEDLRINPFDPNHYQRQEVIGPHQVEGDRLWFGNRYYDGEGDTGVGAFGYFDTATRRYTIFRPREMARCEASAILVEPATVWVALDRFGEDIATSPGGLLEWNRSTHEVRKHDLEFVVDSIRPEGGALRLNNRYGGYAILRNGEVRRYLGGKPVRRFPPPPTHN